MKKIILVLLLGGVVFAAGSAQAYTVNNTSDHTACVANGFNLGNCIVKVSKHSSYNSKHDAGLDGVTVGWKDRYGNCHWSNKFNIPKGGHIRIYNNEVHVYNQHDKRQRTLLIDTYSCY
ncbi:MAG: hypothetical protein K9K65_10040 [Desulfarculaceae bacterium]|nr:hypothetical protein [Desulfarculaceae bacterium]MCF8048819.1 hypothetical protein [Desulfarculaceae bacterium]MCF8064537.1 hypothetical protein [Desulfarculaceae bacterium]MCF8098170.1 hypothetical protein [Desulfarculaceae bacterium]MCF8121966.1 hypothetical protein [Desulfarculaceae bacterium]